jgi:cyanophycinase
VATRTNGTRKRRARTNDHSRNAVHATAPKFIDVQAQMLPARASKHAGSLIIIGGREDKEGDKDILREVCSRIRNQKLVIATIATSHPDEVWEEYRHLFRELGVTSLAHLHIESRHDAFSTDRLAVLDGAGAVFFTGGDQLRITSRIGGAPVCERIREIFGKGGIIAGTSAGASAVSETMLVSAPSGESHKVESLQMAPGLGFLRGVIIDQHFAERGRLGRLVGAVAQNPRLLGVGIDEDTAIVAESQGFRVIGSGAVYVVDGMRESYTNLSEEEPGEVVSVFDLRLHILSSGDHFDLDTRHPSKPEGDRAPASNGRGSARNHRSPAESKRAEKPS